METPTQSTSVQETKPKMARPGIIIVRSSLDTLDFTVDDLTAWYETKHIPEVLATGGVESAARYMCMTPPYPNGPITYLAVYRVPDMNWLHTEECGFWKLPLTVDDRHGTQRCIQKLASFGTLYWEILAERTSEGHTVGECRM